MRRSALIGIVLIALGVAFWAYSMSSGEATAYIFLFIPVFQGSSLSALAGTLLLFIGIFLLFFSLASPIEAPSESAPPKTHKEGAVPGAAKKFGGVVFVGPLPVVFGSDKRVAKWMLIVALIIVVLLVAVSLYFAIRPPR